MVNKQENRAQILVDPNETDNDLEMGLDVAPAPTEEEKEKVIVKNALEEIYNQGVKNM